MSVFLTTQNSSAIYTARLIDGSGAPITNTTTFDVTLYDQDTNAIINGRDNSSEDLFIDADGVVTWLMSEFDNPILNDQLFEEIHIALFKIIWAGGMKQLYHELTIRTRNVGRVA